MKGLAFLTLAAQAVPKVLEIRHRTWWLIGGGLLMLLIGMLWAAISLLGWFFGQVQSWSAAAPTVTQETLAGVQAQAERMVPAARELLDRHLGDQVSDLKAPEKTWREVSGTDIGPVPRYPGLVRTYWHREGRQVNVHYEGRAGMAEVLAHYAQGFAELGFAHEVRAATADAETHVWTQDANRYVVKITSKSPGEIAIDLETKI